MENLESIACGENEMKETKHAKDIRVDVPSRAVFRNHLRLRYGAHQPHHPAWGPICWPVLIAIHNLQRPQKSQLHRYSYKRSPCRFRRVCPHESLPTANSPLCARSCLHPSYHGSICARPTCAWATQTQAGGPRICSRFPSHCFLCFHQTFIAVLRDLHRDPPSNTIEVYHQRAPLVIPAMQMRRNGTPHVHQKCKSSNRCPKVAELRAAAQAARADAEKLAWAELESPAKNPDSSTEILPKVEVDTPETTPETSPRALAKVPFEEPANKASGEPKSRPRSVSQGTSRNAQKQRNKRRRQRAHSRGKWARVEGAYGSQPQVTQAARTEAVELAEIVEKVVVPVAAAKATRATQPTKTTKRRGAAALMPQVTQDPEQLEECFDFEVNPKDVPFIDDWENYVEAEGAEAEEATPSCPTSASSVACRELVLYVGLAVAGTDLALANLLEPAAETTLNSLETAVLVEPAGETPRVSFTAASTSSECTKAAYFGESAKTDGTCEPADSAQHGEPSRRARFVGAAKELFSASSRRSGHQRLASAARRAGHKVKEAARLVKEESHRVFRSGPPKEERVPRKVSAMTKLRMLVVVLRGC